MSHHILLIMQQPFIFIPFIFIVRFKLIRSHSHIMPLSHQIHPRLFISYWGFLALEQITHKTRSTAYSSRASFKNLPLNLSSTQILKGPNLISKLGPKLARSSLGYGWPGSWSPLRHGWKWVGSFYLVSKKCGTPLYSPHVDDPNHFLWISSNFVI